MEIIGILPRYNTGTMKGYLQSISGIYHNMLATVQNKFQWSYQYHEMSATVNVRCLT